MRQLPLEVARVCFMPVWQKTPLPLQCEVVELGSLVYSVAMSRVWLSTYQGCCMTAWSDDDGEAVEDDDEDELSIIYGVRVEDSLTNDIISERIAI